MPSRRTTQESAPCSNTYRLHEFDPVLYDWSDWEVLRDTYIEVENIVDDVKKRNLLITALAVQPFKTLISVCKPNKPTECTYQEIIQKLRSNYSRVTFASTERIKFFASKQDSNQTLTDFANGLRDKTVSCNFPADFYEEALITAFVGGLRNENIRKHLMQTNLKTFEQTLNVAKTFESVLIQGSMNKSDVSDDASVFKIQKQTVKKPIHRSSCISCGATDHQRFNCRFRFATCHKCNKEGHIAKVCHSRSQSKSFHKQFHHNINSVFVVQNDYYSDTINPIRMSIEINRVRIQFDLDTGSPITIINENVWRQIGMPQLEPINSCYTSFTGHSLQFSGSAYVEATYNSQRAKIHVFVSKQNRHNIFGRDSINVFRLNTLSLNELIFNDTNIHNIDDNFRNLDQLLNHYNEIFKDGLGCCKLKAHLHVKQNVLPKFHKARSLPFAYRDIVEKELNRLVTASVLEPVDTSVWASPIVVVPKPGGRIRICADLSTGVNQALDINQYPLPKPDDLFVALNGGVIFSKIDFSEAYLQVELDDDSKQYLTINTHKGLFRFNRLPFGVASAPSIFQKIMDQMFAGLEGAVSYLDDIIVTGMNEIDHLQKLNKVFARIQEFGFHINKEKCHFFQHSVEYLGFVVDKNGIHTSPAKTEAIHKMPRPTNLSQLRSFLGMINHYAKFIPKLNERLAPFYSLLKKNTPWTWNEHCEKAFSNAKRLLVSPLALAHYDPSLPLVLAADASNAGVGAVIYHRYPDGTEKAIAHASKTLSKTETHYAQIEKEALALIFGVQKFDQFIRGRKFILLTDHKPLISIFGSKKGISSTSANRLQRWGTSDHYSAVF